MKKIIITIFKIFIFFIGWAVMIGMLEIPSNDPAIWRFGAEFIPFIVIVAFSILFWLIEKRNVPIIEWNSPMKNVVVGIFAGMLDHNSNINSNNNWNNYLYWKQ